MSRKFGIIIGLVAFILAALVLWVVLRRPKAVELPLPVDTPVPEISPTPTLAEQLTGRLKGVSLGTADPVLREMAAGLSSRPELARWLASEDLIRRVVASVDNIARGKDPRVHLDFLKPLGHFRVLKKGTRLIIDPACYRRYDTVAGVIESVDTPGLVLLYHQIEALLEEADREISPPGENFRQHLAQAIDQLLLVPVLTSDVEVTEKVVTYVYVDPQMEALSAAQRHFLRMGPDNVRIIQAKLLEIKSALGL